MKQAIVSHMAAHYWLVGQSVGWLVAWFKSHSIGIRIRYSFIPNQENFKQQQQQLQQLNKKKNINTTTKQNVQLNLFRMQLLLITCRTAKRRELLTHIPMLGATQTHSHQRTHSHTHAHAHHTLQWCMSFSECE